MSAPRTTPNDLCADAQERSPQTSKEARRARRRKVREDRIEPCDPICVECGKLAEMVKGKRLYPHRTDLFPKNFYLCECGAYVGCHPFTRIALGRPAGPVTRAARSRAHNAFDLLWKRKMKTGATQAQARNAGYEWLAGEMGVELGKCHIGWMSAAEANRVVAICNPWIHGRANGALEASRRTTPPQLSEPKYSTPTSETKGAGEP